MKKVLVISLLATLLLSSRVIGVSAASEGDLLVKAFVEEITPITEEWENPKIKKGEKLYGAEHEQIGYIYRVYEGQMQAGYVLYLDELGIVEAKWTGTDKAIDIKGSVYYFPPGTFMSKQEYVESQTIEQNNTDIEVNKYYGSIYDIFYIGSDAFATELDITVGITNVPALSGNLLTYSSSYSVRKTIDVMPQYFWTEGCAPTSAGMFVAYYDNEMWDYLSDEEIGDFNMTHNTYEAEPLIQELASSAYMNTDSLGGTSLPDIVDGLEEYFHDAGLTQYEVYTGAFTTGQYNFNTYSGAYKSLIYKGNPAIITMVGHPEYGNHAVLGMGHLLARSVGEGAIVHDTWDNGSDEVFLNYSVLEYYIFIYDN